MHFGIFIFRLAFIVGKKRSSCQLSHLWISTSTHTISTYHLHIYTYHLLISTCRSLILRFSHFHIYKSTCLHAYTSTRYHGHNSTLSRLHHFWFSIILASLHFFSLFSVPRSLFYFFWFTLFRGRCQRGGTKRNWISKNWNKIAISHPQVISGSFTQEGVSIDRNRRTAVIYRCPRQPLRRKCGPIGKNYP